MKSEKQSCVGQVWEETYRSSKQHILFVVLRREEWGVVGGTYELLNLETGEQDCVAVHALDTPLSHWRRIA